MKRIALQVMVSALQCKDNCNFSIFQITLQKYILSLEQELNEAQDTLNLLLEDSLDRATLLNNNRIGVKKWSLQRGRKKH